MKNNLNDVLHNSYFIGGSPCSGKSTTAELLADKYNWQYYKIDDYDLKHLKRAQKENHPVMIKFKEMSWNQIWMRDPQLQAEEEFEFYRERFEFILDDLKKYSKDDKLIIESAALLPELLKELNLRNDQIIYMVPSKKFQVKYYSQRSFKDGILKECRQPKKAFQNWMERDHLFGRKVKEQAAHLGFKVLEVDGSHTVEENLKTIENHFGLK